MRQRGLSIVTDILPGKEEELRTFLNTIGTRIQENPHIRFDQLRTVHFMRWVVVPAQEVRGYHCPAKLVLGSNFDGHVTAHLEELIAVSGPGLDRIYAFCKDFQPNKGPAYQLAYLEKHIHKNSAWYEGHTGRNLTQIKREQALRDTIQDTIEYINPSGNWNRKTSKQVREEILKPVLAKPDFQWAKTNKLDTFLQRFGIPLLGLGLLLGIALYVLGFICCPIVTAAILAVKVLTIAWWFKTLHAHERRDAANFQPPPRDSSKVSSLLDREDFKVQNQITHLVTIRPGFFRQSTIRFILSAIQLLAWTVFNKGNLGGIPSIHFARWMILDGGRRLLFFSNFDGSWESYLGDFVDKASIGLTGVWSNTEGFPPTHNLVKAGARNEENFKAWVRQKQIETQVWYSAYMDLSVLNVNNNTKIRQGAAGNLNEKEATEWLRKL